MTETKNHEKAPQDKKEKVAMIKMVQKNQNRKITQKDCNKLLLKRKQKKAKKMKQN